MWSPSYIRFSPCVDCRVLININYICIHEMAARVSCEVGYSRRPNRCYSTKFSQWFCSISLICRCVCYSPGRFGPGDLGGVSEQYFKPVFRKVPADLEVPQGHLARFDCVVSGRPIPDMLWFRDGTEVLPDLLHKIVINEEGISSLIIDATRLSDSGLYTCIARNRAGEDRFQVRLNILRTF